MAKPDIVSFIKNPLGKKYRGYLVYYLDRGYAIFCNFLDLILGRIQFIAEKPFVKITLLENRDNTSVEEYWSDHTVAARFFKSPFFSKTNISGRFRWYPKFKELMALYGNHRGEVILDYGCGPGNDLVGFALYSNAKKIIGMDVSEKALSLAQKRLYLHNEINPARVELVQISDESPKIPLKNSSIDYIYSGGVLHHTSNMADILKELYRILKPGSFVNIMVYNQKSIFYHLWLPYEAMIVLRRFPGLKIDQAFTKSTDGPECPISKCFSDEEFVKIGEKIGFRCIYLGGYLSKTELESMKKYLKEALGSRLLSQDHKKFLKALTFDQKGLPLYQGKYAGIGGVYRFYKD